MTSKHLISIALVGSLLINAGALFFQFIVGILPCHLCVLQRYPHWALVAIAAFILLTNRFRFAWAGVAVALYSVGLGIYHSGVERKLWDGPSDCTGGMDLSSMSGNDLLSTEIGTPLIACDEISFSILGLTFANMNVLGSLALLIIWISAARRA